MKPGKIDADWFKTYLYVKQCKDGDLGIALVPFGNKGLYTKNLFNCICLIFGNDKTGTYGMLHHSPRSETLAKAVETLRDKTQADTVIIAGANSGNYEAGLPALLSGLVVVDCTYKQVYPPQSNYSDHRAEKPNVRMVGWAGVKKSTGEYALGAVGFEEDQLQQSDRCSIQ